MAGALVLRLELGATVLDLNDPDSTGFIIDSVDLGAPTPRSIVDDLAGQDGTDDQTAFFSSRTIQLSGHAGPTVSQSRSLNLDALAPFLHPRARPTLVYALDLDMDERCFDLRVDQWSDPTVDPADEAFSVQWVCPNPIAYSKAVHEADIPFATGSTSGRTYPRIYPLTYPAGGSSSGEAFVTTDGTYDSWPTVRFYGPCANPKLFWIDPVSLLDLGTQIVFDGLTVALGDYVEVNTLTKTALLNGSPGANRYNFIDFANTTWGPLSAGENLLRFAPDSASTPAQAAVLWRDSFLR